MDKVKKNTVENMNLTKDKLCNHARMVRAHRSFKYTNSAPSKANSIEVGGLLWAS